MAFGWLKQMLGLGGDNAASTHDEMFETPTLGSRPPIIDDEPTMDTPNSVRSASKADSVGLTPTAWPVPPIAYDDATDVPIDSRERFPEGESGSSVPAEDVSGPGVLTSRDYDLVPNGLRFHSAHELRPLAPYPRADPPELPEIDGTIMSSCVLTDELFAIACADGGVRMYSTTTLEKLDCVDLGAYALLPIRLGCADGVLCVDIAGGTYLGLRWTS